MPEQSVKAAFITDPVRRLACSVVSCIVFVALGLMLLKFYEDGMRKRERGRLVSSIVDQQFSELSSGVVFQPGLPARPAPVLVPARIPQDSLQLRRWLVHESFTPGETPADTAVKLERLERAHAADLRISPVMRESLLRWKESLLSWNGESAGDSGLLEDARQRYFDAAGLQKIGRSYDATVLHLWTISLLTRYVERNPFSPHMPEALFMLGVAYLNLGQALPPQMRRDRILTLCGELYPDSLWASRSNAIWKEAFSREI